MRGQLSLVSFAFYAAVAVAALALVVLIYSYVSGTGAGAYAAPPAPGEVYVEDVVAGNGSVSIIVVNDAGRPVEAALSVVATNGTHEGVYVSSVVLKPGKNMLPVVGPFVPPLTGNITVLWNRSAILVGGVSLPLAPGSGAPSQYTPRPRALTLVLRGAGSVSWGGRALSLGVQPGLQRLDVEVDTYPGYERDLAWYKTTVTLTDRDGRVCGVYCSWKSYRREDVETTTIGNTTTTTTRCGWDAECCLRYRTWSPKDTTHVYTCAYYHLRRYYVARTVTFRASAPYPAYGTAYYSAATTPPPDTATGQWPYLVNATDCSYTWVTLSYTYNGWYDGIFTHSDSCGSAHCVHKTCTNILAYSFTQPRYACGFDMCGKLEPTLAVSVGPVSTQVESWAQDGSVVIEVTTSFSVRYEMLRDDPEARTDNITIPFVLLYSLALPPVEGSFTLQPRDRLLGVSVVYEVEALGATGNYTVKYDGGGVLGGEVAASALGKRVTCSPTVSVPRGTPGNGYFYAGGCSADLSVSGEIEVVRGKAATVYFTITARYRVTPVAVVRYAGVTG